MLIENPQRFHPLLYWGLAAFVLATPFLAAERWWLQLLCVPMFWTCAYLAARLGIESRRRRQEHQQGLR